MSLCHTAQLCQSSRALCSLWERIQTPDKACCSGPAPAAALMASSWEGTHALLLLLPQVPGFYSLGCPQPQHKLLSALHPWACAIHCISGPGQLSGGLSAVLLYAYVPVPCKARTSLGSELVGARAPQS